MKVGILTFHFANNIGAVLNAYGLQCTLLKMGIDAYIINFVPSGILDHSSLIPSPSAAIYDFKNASGVLKRYPPRLIARLIDLPKNRSKSLKFNEFRHNYLKIKDEPFPKLAACHCDSFDACIVGSDQVWNPHYLQLSNLAYLLPFKLVNTLKIAYAASVVEDLSGKQLNVFKRNLESFSSISVRESSTAKTLTRLLGKKVHQTLDPTLLLNESDYNIIIQKSKMQVPNKYIFVYRFGTLFNNRVDKMARKLSTKLGIPIVTIGAGLNRHCYVSPTEFIWLLKNAAFVITDSYHGTLLSIKFRKKFFVVFPRSRKMRIDDILNKLGLEDRTGNVNKIFEDIDYNSVDKLLDQERRYSLSFLKTALNQ